jgi:hypothetical protein
MFTIEIDSEVMAYLTSHASPFVDTPNTVLRRLLSLDAKTAATTPDAPVGPARPTLSGPPSGSTPRTRQPEPDKGDRHQFVSQVLAGEFGGRFRVRSPYQMMFESDHHLVYFQNFNATGSHNLWFRINERPLAILRDTRKAAFVCMTNPAEGYAFLLPIDDVLERVRRANWMRSELEVNIDPSSSKWRELDWDLTPYRKKY